MSRKKYGKELKAQIQNENYALKSNYAEALVYTVPEAAESL